MAHPVLRVHTTSGFAKSFSKLSASIQRLATKKDKWFRSDAFDKRLDTHKLRGELKGYVAYLSILNTVCYSGLSAGMK